ncbi:MAG TPA: nitrate/nitrite transporter [Polyangiaceae bacterium]|nr:nitrate/nitrite transporter [Polyangiaceae bacterium]
MSTGNLGSVDFPPSRVWDPEQRDQWEAEGQFVARRTLWITTCALTLSFATWFVWSALVVRLPVAGFALSISQRFWLVALPGLVGATLRVPYSFLIQVLGTRLVVTAGTASLLIPALGIGFAVQDASTSYATLIVLAAAAGLGGANFSAFMSSTSLFFPKKRQGTALGIQAGLGNLGVSLVQFLTPWLIGLGAFAWGPSQALKHGNGVTQVWLQNAAFFWVLPIALTLLAELIWLRDVPVKSTIREQSVIFRRKHTWIMTLLYVMTFGTFSGFAAATGLLVGEVFSGQRFANAPDPLAYAFWGPLVGSLVRPLGGYISDKLGGAKVTLACALVLALSMLGLAYTSHPTSAADFPGFFAALLVVFFASGIGNGSTFRMIPVIFEPKEAAPVLGWTAAIAAYGAFLLPLLFGSTLSQSGNANGAFFSLAAFYLGGALLCYWFYARAAAERPC